jgi:hypothetical protein
MCKAKTRMTNCIGISTYDNEYVPVGTSVTVFPAFPEGTGGDQPT